MIGLEDRQSIAQYIDAAHDAGARLHKACDVVGINVRTLQRWRGNDGLVAGDQRPTAVRPIPAHALSAKERAQVLRAGCHHPLGGAASIPKSSRSFRYL